MDKKNKSNIAKILLAFGVLASPMMLANQVSADNSIANTTNANNIETKTESDAVTTENVINENKENKKEEKTQPEATTPEATTTENTATDATESTSQKEEKSDENTELVENKEEVDFKLDASQRHELKEAGYTDEQIQEIENSIKKSLIEDSKFNFYDFIASKVDDKKAEKENTSLELSDNLNGDAVRAEAVAAEARTEAKDISNEITNQYVALTKEGHETQGTVKPDAGEAIGWEVSFTTPRGTIAGDYFTIDLSENLSLKGIEPDHENEYPIEINDKVVADGVRLDRSTIKYTFNENVNDERNVRVSVKGFAYVDKTKVPNTTDEKFSIAVGDTKDEKTIKVKYGDTYFTGDHLNGVSQFTEFNPKTGEYTQVFYINPESKTITTSNRNWATGKVAMFIDGITPDGSPSDVHYTEENTRVSIKKLPAGTDVPLAIIENPVETDEETMVKTVFRDGGIEITFAENGDDKLRHNNIDSPYIVTVKSTAAPSQTGNNVYSRATLYGDGTRYHVMDNSIVTTEGDTEAQGDKVGYFKEHHIYYTKVDGVLQEDQTFTIHSSKTEGFDYDNYFTSKNEIDDFKFVKVDTDNLVENPAYNADGSLARGGYEVGKTKEVTYIYVRDIKHGSFQEHHIYQTLDENGKVIAEETVTKDGKETTGIDENEYSTSKKDQDGNVVTEEKDKDGYKLVEVKATNDKSKDLGVQFDGQGAAISGNYVNGEKLEVTYIYQKQKPVAKKGSFKETHVYKTLDFEGNVVEEKTITEAGKSSEGTKDEKYESSKVDKAGYEFTKVTADEGSDEVTISEDGKQVESGNYVEDKELAVTYEYVKQPGRFVEHHIYKTVDKEGNVVSTDKTVNLPEDGQDPFEGYSSETISTKQRAEEGYTFKEATDIKLQNDDSEKTYSNYVPGKVLEKTYIYTKTQTEWTPIEETGKFQEHHIYITKDKDGKEIGREVVDGKVSGGTKDMTYTTGKKDKDGFKFVRTEDAKENPSYDKDGKETKGNYKPGVSQEITYVYEKTESDWAPIEETGKFQEHHIYITKDKDGKEIKREVVDGKVSGGTKDMTYETGKKEKDGFKFVRTETPVNEPTFDKDGAETEGNYKPGVKQEITYVYEKTQTEWTPIEKTGKFQEHHVYRTLDKDGKVIKEEKVDGDVTGGTSKMTYTTGKIDKEGFEYKRTETPVENPTFNEDGSKATGNYKPGVKQEITYVYERTETPWTPLEPSEPVTPVEPEEPTTPVVPDQPEEPTTPVTPETPAEDPKETPWTPLTPAEEVTPQTPDDNKTPKDEPKETPKEDSKETSEKQTEKQSKKLPKAGADYELLQLAAGALTLVSGMGISLSRKKRD